jgi:hypothetical protein
MMAFINTMNALNGQDDQQKQDIFGATGGADPLAPGAPTPAAQGAGAGLTKTEVGGPGEASAGGTGPAKQETVTPAAQSAAFQKQVSQATAPKDIGEAKTTVQSAKQRQQAAADQFVTQAGQSQAFQDQDIEAAISGGDQGKAVRSALSGQRKDVGQFALPTEDITQAKEFVNEQGGLSEAGLKKMFSRGAGPEYSAADAGFDAALARRNKGLQSQARELATTIREKEASEGALGQATTEKARAAAMAADDSRNKALREALTSKRDAVMKAAQDRAAAENARQASFKAARDELIRERPELEGQLGNNQELLGSLGQTYGLTGDVTADDVLTSDEASRWSNIMDLLGEGYTAKSAKGNAFNASTDTAAYKKSLAEAADLENQRGKALLASMVPTTAPAPMSADAFQNAFKGVSMGNVASPDYIDLRNKVEQPKIQSGRKQGSR